MREDTLLQAINGDNNKGGRFGFFVLIIVIAHVVFYFVPSFYLPFDLGELFVFGYVLVIADSGIVIFLGIKLFDRVLSGNKTE